MRGNLGCLLRRQLEEVSKIIFSIIHEYYTESAATAVKTGIVVSYQSFGDLMRWKPCSSCAAGTAREFAEGKLHHYHCLVLEGGIDEVGSFHHIPIKDTSLLTEVFIVRWRAYHTKCQDGAGRGLFRKSMRWTRGVCVANSLEASFLVVLAKAKTTLVCTKCGSEMKIIAVINDLSKVDKILECLKRNNAPPFDKLITKAC